MKIVHVSIRDSEEGASRAAYRIHRAQVEAGLDSRMRVLVSGTGDDRVISGSCCSLSTTLVRALQRRTRAFSQRGWQTDNPVLHTFGEDAIGLIDELNLSDVDIVNLHWISGLLSVAEVGRIRKPIVWTFHDMWPFCGGEHYAPNDSSARFRKGYQTVNRPPGERGPDLNRKTWESKKKAWSRQKFNIVCPSHWLADCAQQSVLFADADVCVIPHPLETESLWRPVPRDAARRELDLPADKKLILMGAPGGTTDPRKGGDLLNGAVHQLAASQLDDVELVIYGQTRPVNSHEWPCRVHWLGEVRDDRVLSQAYSAADVMVVPSRQEAFGQTASEAQACGTPVVAFGIGGLPDIVEHQVTGYLARPFEVSDLSDGISWVLNNEERRCELAAAARASSLRKFAEPLAAEAYTELYKKVLAGQGLN